MKWLKVICGPSPAATKIRGNMPRRAHAANGPGTRRESGACPRFPEVPPTCFGRPNENHSDGMGCDLRNSSKNAGSKTNPIFTPRGPLVGVGGHPSRRALLVRRAASLFATVLSGQTARERSGSTRAGKPETLPASPPAPCRRSSSQPPVPGWSRSRERRPAC